MECIVREIKKSTKDNNFYVSVEIPGKKVNGFQLPVRKWLYCGSNDPSKAWKIGSKLELEESDFL